jgi:rod shape-determining protein MreD
MGSAHSTSVAGYRRLTTDLSTVQPDVSRETIEPRSRRLGDFGPYTGSASTVRRPGENRAISYLSPLLAVVTGIVHAGLAPMIVVGGVKPDLMLVAVVLVTCRFGMLAGATWAFVGGLTANLLVTQPLGSIPLSLLVVAAVVAGGNRLFGSLVWLYPILAGLVGSGVADVVRLLIASLVDDPGSLTLPIELIAPAAVLNAAIVALLLFPMRTITDRYAHEERPAW